MPEYEPVHTSVEVEDNTAEAHAKQKTLFDVIIGESSFVVQVFAGLALQLAECALFAGFFYLCHGLLTWFTTSGQWLWRLELGILVSMLLAGMYLSKNQDYPPALVAVFSLGSAQLVGMLVAADSTGLLFSCLLVSIFVAYVLVVGHHKIPDVIPLKEFYGTALVFGMPAIVAIGFILIAVGVPILAILVVYAPFVYFVLELSMERVKDSKDKVNKLVNAVYDLLVKLIVAVSIPAMVVIAVYAVFRPCNSD